MKLAAASAAGVAYAPSAKAETVIPTPRWDGSKHALAGKPLPKWQPGQFQVHHVHTGVAESSFWIFPDGTTMLLDCGCHPAINRGQYAVQVLPSGRRHASEWITRYVERVNPNGRDVDYMMLTHYHDDHGGNNEWGAGVIDWKGEKIMNSGFVQAAQRLRFGKALDRCYPTYDQPVPTERSSTTPSTMAHVRKTYRYLSERDGTKIERFKVGATDQIVMLRDPKSHPGFTVTNVCGNGVIRTRDGGTRDLYAQNHDAQKIDENSASTGVIAQYGAFRFISAGDFAGCIKLPNGQWLNFESELAKEIDPVDVAKISHHGYYSTPPDYVRAIRPRVWTSCVWDQLHNEEHTLANICRGYDEPRLILPTVFPAERQISDAGRPWMGDIAPESFRGCHVVITVPPGGRTYGIACLSAVDESMKVVGAYDFTARGC